jgi:predicted exporter
MAGTTATGRPSRLPLAGWVLALLLCGLVIARSHFTADMSAFLPASPNPGQQVLIDQIRQGTPARTLLIGIEGGDAAQRAEASRALARALRGSGLFEQVQNGERGDWAASGEWIVAHRYLLSPAVTPERFSVAGLRDAITDTLSLLGTPAGVAVKPLLASDPTGETQRIAEGLIPAQSPRSQDGVWVSREAPRAVLLASTRAPGDDLDAQAAAITQVRAAFAPSAQAGLRLLLSGAPLFAVNSRGQIEREVQWLSMAGAVLVGGLLWAAFASLRAVAVAALPVLAGVAAGITAVSLGFGTVHGMTLGFGTTLIGEAVDYAIYYLIQARSGLAAGGPPGQGWRAWRRESWPTVRLGLLTSLCGFAALAFSGFPGLAQLGVFSIAGLVAAALTARWVLPVLQPDGAGARGWRAPLGRACRRALAPLRRSRPVWLALSATALAALVLSPGPLWRGDLSALSPMPAPALALDAQLRADIGGSDSSTLVIVRADSQEAALQGAEAAAARLEGWVDSGRLLGYDTPTRLLPSQATQAGRRASLPEPAVLAARWREAAAGSPLDTLPPQDFFMQVAQARQAPALDWAALRASPLAPMVGAMLIAPAGGATEGAWTALLPLHEAPDRPLDSQALRQALAGIGGAQVMAVKVELDGLYRGYLGEAMWQAWLGAAAVLCLLAAWLRSARRVARVAVPLALAVVLCLGGLHVLGAPLGVLHLVGLLLVMAVGSNYALFFDTPPAQLGDDALASMCLANLTTVLSFGLIASSQIPALAAIGQVVAPGAALALVLSAAFTPGGPGAPDPV